jgi:hypothetical protein
VSVGIMVITTEMWNYYSSLLKKVVIVSHLKD